MTTLEPQPRTGLPSLRDVLLVQCGVSDVSTVGGFLRPGGGLVVTGSRSVFAARTAVSVGVAGPVLVDRALYAGTHRKSAGEPLDPAWVAAQLSAGAAVALTDSGYVAQDDLPGLRAILAGASRLPQGAVVAVLPVHRAWLTSRWRELADEVNAHGLPVALVVEHAKDPFGVRAAVLGLSRFLNAAEPPVMLLRSDISALGAMACGALAGAVGVRPGLRHLYAPSPGGPRRNNAPAAMWRPGLYMVGVDRMAAAHARTPGDPLWVCYCGVCRGRTVDWLYMTAAPEEVTAHTLECLFEERDALAGLPPGVDRRESWRAVCRSAEFQFLQVAASSVRWDVPPAVRWWQEV